MRRKTLDLLLTLVGALITVGLLVASGLLAWGYTFANSQVHNQLEQQRVYFPTKSQLEGASYNKLITPYLLPYAGKELLTGREAEVYADHYIAVHLQEIGGGKTYSQITAKEGPLSQTAQLLFQGNTLRGELLTAYAFGTFALIAEWSVVTALILAVLMFVLTLLGWRHYRRRDPDEVI